MLLNKYADDCVKTSFVSPTADNFRPYVTSFQGNNCTDYINAVFVDVSTVRSSFIF